MQPIIANLGTMDNPIPWIIIAVVVMLLFGGSKLKDFGKSLGEGINEFKKATNEPKADDAGKPTSEAPTTVSPGAKKES